MMRSEMRSWSMIAVAVAVACVGASGCCVNRCGEPLPTAGAFASGWHLLTGERYASVGPATFAERAACRTGCAEIYVDEWLSDPPEDCDPCDDHGNWIGPQPCCRKRPVGGLWSLLWGCRGDTCADGECCDGSCEGGCESRGAFPCETACGVEPLSCVDRADAHVLPEVEEVEPPYAPQQSRPAPPAAQRTLPNGARLVPPAAKAPHGNRMTRSGPGPQYGPTTQSGPTTRSGPTPKVGAAANSGSMAKSRAAGQAASTTRPAPTGSGTPAAKAAPLPPKRTARTSSRFPARPVQHVE